MPFKLGGEELKRWSENLVSVSPCRRFSIGEQTDYKKYLGVNCFHSVLVFNLERKKALNIVGLVQWIYMLILSHVQKEKKKGTNV